MPRDKKAVATERLHDASARYEVALEGQKKARGRLEAAIVKGDKAGLTKAEMARVIGTSPQRVSQIIDRVKVIDVEEPVLAAYRSLQVGTPESVLFDFFADHFDSDGGRWYSGSEAGTLAGVKNGATVAAELATMGLLRRGTMKHLDAAGRRTLIPYQANPRLMKHLQTQDD